MSRLIRLGLVAAGVLVSLAFTGSALASYAPSLTVTSSVNAPGKPTSLLLGHIQSAADDPTAKDTIYAPLGYGVNLSQAPGTNMAINGLTQTVNILQPVIRYLGPFVTVCNGWNYVWTEFQDHLSEATNFAFAQRVILNSGNHQTNSVANQGATAQANGKVVIAWSGTGTLQSTTALLGGWTDVTPAPTGTSYTTTVSAQKQQFFRLRQP